MKIFGWIRHKSRDSKGYALVSRSKVEDQKMESALISKKREDKQALLLLEQTGNIVETVLMQGWHDGILSIGTFGFHEITPAMDNDGGVELARDGAKKGGELGDDISKRQLEVLCSNTLEVEEEEEGMGLTDMNMQWLALLQEEPALMEYSIAEEAPGQRKRTTLADLFSRHDVLDKPAPESGAKAEVGIADGCKMMNKKKVGLKKSGEVMSKGKVASGGDEPGPSTTIHKLMSKMMKKKKIHPDAADSPTIKENSIESLVREKVTMIGADSSQRIKKKIGWVAKVSII